MSGIFIRNAKTISFDATLRRLATTGETGEKLAKGASRQLEPRTTREMKRQYNHLLKTVGQVLDRPGAHGLGNPLSGGSGAVQVSGPNGDSISVRLSSYDPLTKNYADRKPKSTQFWKKHKRAKPPRRPMSLSRTFKQAVRGKGKVTADLGKLRETRVGKKSRYQQRIRFTFGRLPAPLNDIIVNSFVTGKHVDPLQSGRQYSRNGIGVIAYPEHFRPLIGRIAARLSDEINEGLQESTTRLGK